MSTTVDTLGPGRAMRPGPWPVTRLYFLRWLLGALASTAETRMEGS